MSKLVLIVVSNNLVPELFLFEIKAFRILTESQNRKPKQVFCLPEIPTQLYYDFTRLFFFFFVTLLSPSLTIAHLYMPIHNNFFHLNGAHALVIP